MENIEKAFEFKTRKEWEEFIWLKLLEDIKKTRSEKQLKELLNILISQKERKFIIKRLMTIYLIQKGKSYQEIGNLLWISPATISAIKKSLLKKSVYQARPLITDTSDKNKKRININNMDLAEAAEEMLCSLGEILDKYIPPISGRGRWRFLKI